MPSSATKMWRWRLMLFDLRHGLPIALARLSAALGFRQVLGLLPVFLWRSAFNNPLKRLPRARTWRESFTRHQLRPVLILEDVLLPKLGSDRTQVLLTDVVSHSGARFIASQAPHPMPEAWRALRSVERRGVAEALLERFGNAEATIVEQSDNSLGFDVTFCHFVALCQTLGRPHLAPLFCKADSVYYDAPDARIRLQRPQTLAAGGDRCAFRLTFTAAEETSSAPSAHADDSQPDQRHATVAHR